jgi:GT2 family glycosyltransferase
MRIAAVIVTYNRLECLKHCVVAVQGQSCRPDEVIIVNNGSTDGTPGWLTEQRGVTVITQPNLGGAGGFQTGFKQAFERGYDWVWCMDDDGKPAANCLEQLLAESAAGLAFRSPLVLAIDNPADLAFELLPKEATVNITTKEQAIQAAKGGLLPEIASPFNGTLISREVFQLVGFPIADLFIWGDEVEFQSRVQRAGFKVGIVTGAEFLHPRNRLSSVTFHIRGGTHSFPQRTGSRLRDYLAIRNSAYIEFRYIGKRWALRRHCYCTLYHLREFGLRVAWQAFCAGQAGIWGYLGGHRKFLKP